jgi:hypothetical protein
MMFITKCKLNQHSYKNKHVCIKTVLQHIQVTLNLQHLGLLIIIKSGDPRDIVYISIFFILPQKLTQPLLSFFQDNANI